MFNKVNQTQATVYEAVAGTIISAIEEMIEKKDQGDWTMPWSFSMGKAVNAYTLRPLNGVSQVVCGVSAASQGFTSNAWLTFNQAKKAGGKIKKGQKATRIAWLRPFVKDPVTGRVYSPSGDELQEAIANGDAFWSWRYSPYFNVEQVEGLPDSYYWIGRREALGEDFNPHQEAEKLVAGLVGSKDPLDLRHEGAKAFYNRTQDFVSLPVVEAFSSMEGYYSTLFHEIGHWTGHESRLDRDMGKKFGSADYALEELVAEFTAAFLSIETGVSQEVRKDHLAYLKNWLSALKDDPKFLFDAAGAASKATRFIKEAAGFEPTALEDNGEEE